MQETVYGVRYDDCGCNEVHRHPNRAEASFWASYQNANGQLMSSAEGGTTWTSVK
jgi:hypothetical protein